MGNCRPKKEQISKTYTYTYTTTSGDPPVSSSTTLSFNHTKKYWYEIDPASNTNKFIQNAQKLEKFITQTIKTPSGEDDNGDVTFDTITVSNQEYVPDGSNGVKPVFERECRANHSYDEEYFYHIFEWPTTFNLTRTVGGFVATTQTSTSPAGGGGGGSTTTALTTYTVDSKNVTATLTLDKVDSSIQSIPTGSYIYHGGTDDNKIFFKYTSTTNTVITEGDTVNGWTVSRVINYITDKSLRKRVVKHSKPGNTNSYIYVGDKSNISVGDGVVGTGIESDTTVTSISSTDNKIVLSNPVKSKKIKSVVFTSAATNKVNASTLCYAELTGSGSSFNTTSTYTATGSGASIKVYAGKGITNRSAVVGTYFAQDKKTLEYLPLFYNKSTDCEQEIIPENDADYIIGSIILNDGTTLLTNTSLCVNPKTETSYIIDNIYWTNFNRPVDKTKLLYWLGESNSKNLSYTELEDRIITHNKTLLNGKKVSKVTDDVCGDEISQTYAKVYNPYKEISMAKNMINTVTNTLVEDDCIDVRPQSAYSVDELSQYLNNTISNTLSSSSIVLPQEMYNQFIGGENSLVNNLMKAMQSIEESVPVNTKIPQVPATIIGENKSSVDLLLTKFKRIPPKFSKLEYLLNDVVFETDDSVIVDSSENKIDVVIKSIPRWEGTVTFNGVTGDNIVNDGYTITTTRTNGYITNIACSAGAFDAVADITNPLNPLVPTTVSKSWVAPTAGDDGLSARPYPEQVWNDGVNQQIDYGKKFQFRVEEISNYIGEVILNKGNGFIDNPVYASLTSNLSSTATTINVDSTSGFLSSGYLIIPKYIEKRKEDITENIESVFYYLGEEIIYYKGKTDTSFSNCIRGVYQTTSTFENLIDAGQFIPGVDYIIHTLGTTNWKSIGAPDNAAVGTIFTATGYGSGTGKAYTFESTTVPFENAPEINSVITSYQVGFKLSQFWPYKKRDET
jgi:hypothetical protein